MNKVLSLFAVMAMAGSMIGCSSPEQGDIDPPATTSGASSDTATTQTTETTGDTGTTTTTG